MQVQSNICYIFKKKQFDRDAREAEWETSAAWSASSFDKFHISYVVKTEQFYLNAREEWESSPAWKQPCRKNSVSSPIYTVRKRFIQHFDTSHGFWAARKGGEKIKNQMEPVQRPLQMFWMESLVCILYFQYLNGIHVDNTGSVITEKNINNAPGTKIWIMSVNIIS